MRIVIACAIALGALADIGFAQPARVSLSEYRRTALLKTGDSSRGKALFLDQERLACTRCHSIDGTASKAGPDLFAVGDKFGRREIIEAVLTPSATIAVGYSTTTVTTRSGDDVQGIIKQSTADAVELMGADGQRVRIATRDIVAQRTSDVSLMPEGLQAGLTPQEFTDLVEYLVTLKQPASASLVEHGMPADIPESSHPVLLTPFPSAEMRFDHPVWFGVVPGASNQFAVIEHETGRVWLLSRGSTGTFEKTLMIEVGRFDQGTRGLLGMVFHPQFQKNHKFYLARHVSEAGKFATLILECECTPDGKPDPARSPRVVMRVDEVTNVHYGGGLAFGPDGFLYVGMGDSGPQEDPQGNGQNTRLWLGKMLRIDVNHPSGDKLYGVPVDNPFIGRTNFLPEIWAYGFREPWRFSFDRVTGELWVGDVGQDRYEEVDNVRRGENYGWNVYEGFEPFSNRYRRDGERFVPPVFAYARKFGPSVTGGFVYRGNPKSPFYGVYIFADYESRRIWGLTAQDRTLKSIRQIGRGPERVVSFGEDAAHELYVVGYEGTIFKMDLSAATLD